MPVRLAVGLGVAYLALRPRRIAQNNIDLYTGVHPAGIGVAAELAARARIKLLRPAIPHLHPPPRGRYDLRPALRAHGADLVRAPRDDRPSPHRR